MKNLLFILFVCCIFTASAVAAINQFTDDFGGAAGTLDATWVDDATLAVPVMANTPVVYNGVGQAALGYDTVNDMTQWISHDLGLGDFHMEIEFENLSKVHHDPYGYEQLYNFLHTDAGVMQAGLKTWANVIYVENLNQNGWVGPQHIITSITAEELTSFDMTLDYDEGLDEYTMTYSLNGGAYVSLGAAAGTGGVPTYRDSTIGYLTWAGLGYGSDMSGDIDYYSVVPEPMTLGLLGFGGLFLRRRKR